MKSRDLTRFVWEFTFASYGEIECVDQCFKANVYRTHIPICNHQSSVANEQKKKNTYLAKDLANFMIYEKWRALYRGHLTYSPELRKRNCLTNMHFVHLKIYTWIIMYITEMNDC